MIMTDFSDELVYFEQCNLELLVGEEAGHHIGVCAQFGASLVHHRLFLR